MIYGRFFAKKYLFLAFWQSKSGDLGHPVGRSSVGRSDVSRICTNYFKATLRVAIKFFGNLYIFVISL